MPSIINKQSIDKLQGKFNIFISRYWSLIHIIFIIFFLLHFILKLNGKDFGTNAVPEEVPGFSLLWFTLDIIGFALIGIMFIAKVNFRLWHYISIISLAFIIIKVSYVITIDKNLSWSGSDVAIGNYISAKECVKYGFGDLLQKWNERTNPYMYHNINGEVKDSVKAFIDRNNLSSLTFDKWKTGLDSSSYELLNNNRPYMHPPLTALIMGLWLKLIPLDRWSLEILMFVISAISIILIIIYSSKKVPINLQGIAIISIATSLSIHRFHSPSADILSMLLYTLPFFIFLYVPKINFRNSFLSGIVFSLCFYTKLNIIIFVILLGISLLIYSKQISIKPFLGLVIGFILPIIIMTLSGYYFWLTLITGHFTSKIFALNVVVTFSEMASKLLFFGPSFILIFLVLLVNSNKIPKKLFPLYFPMIISLFIMIIYLYQFLVLHRYLIQYMPVILLFFLSIPKTIDIKKRDIIVSLVTNFIILQINIYF